MAHINWCSEGWLAKAFKVAHQRKRSRTKAIKVVVRKLVNVVWAVWIYEKEFTMILDEE